ncbi:MAG: Integral membrane protein [uncultured Nocardioidaceae bacterium]|uniref:Integral membrane protein n=1 Tax=uncultured Nocardioidaceae bacterium TaxID=253824 RepID=A0A6J4M849_9ACTN|nr:MAG: Integral membrane protein [uncultured Nocardioidaceae bacterium]
MAEPPLAGPAVAAAAVPAENAGAIHDIGYRHYDGPRLGAAYIRRSLFVETLRGAYGLGRSARSKVMPFVLLGVMVLPAVVIGIVASYIGLDELPRGLDYTTYVITMQVAVTVYLGSQAPAVVSRDLRYRTTALYFSRPLSRQQYVQAKYAGMASALFLLLALPITLLLVGALLAELPLGEQLPDYLRAMAGAALHALVLAGIGLVVAAMTPRRGLGVAAVVGVLIVLSGVQATVRGLAEVFGNDTFSGYTGLLSPFTLVDGVVAGLLGAESSVGREPPGAIGTSVYVVVTVLLLVGCYVALVARYRKALS